MIKMKWFSASALLFITLLIIAGCGNASENKEDSTKNNSGSITAVGSTALQPLVEAAAKEFQINNPQAQINVQGGGSGTGLTQVQQGSVDIGNSDVFAEEKEGVAADKLVDHKIAVIGMAPVTNKSVSVKNLSKQQLIAIFTGKVTNWKEVGGKDEKITVINRAEGSGTRATFEKWALDGAVSVKAQEQDSSGTVRKIISETPGSISYLAFSYIDGSINKLAIDGIVPTEENVATNKWEIWSYEHMYTKGKAKGLTKAFLEYMKSNDVQQHIVSKLGYQSIKTMKIERDAKGKIVKQTN